MPKEDDRSSFSDTENKFARILLLKKDRFDIDEAKRGEKKAQVLGEGRANEWKFPDFPRGDVLARILLSSITRLSNQTNHTNICLSVISKS